MTLSEQIITIGVCVIATMLTRFLPFAVFNEKKQPPKIITYLGEVLPAAVYGLLVVYCLKNVSIAEAPHGLPELIAIAATVLVHLWKKNMLLSMAAGTIVYMLLIRFVF